jgi:hypothetical protein
MQTVTTRTHTHPYEYTYTNSTPMSTSEGLSTGRCEHTMLSLLSTWGSPTYSRLTIQVGTQSTFSFPFMTRAPHTNFPPHSTLSLFPNQKLQLLHACGRKTMVRTRSRQWRPPDELLRADPGGGAPLRAPPGRSRRRRAPSKLLREDPDNDLSVQASSSCSWWFPSPDGGEPDP